MLGIADLLQQSALVAEDAEPALDLSDSHVFTSLLSGIQLAGSNLSTILEGVLDFSRANARRGSQVPLEERLEPLDLTRTLEILSASALEHLHLTSSVGEGNSAQEIKDSLLEAKNIKLPDLIISIEPALERYRCSVKGLAMVEKVLAQIISNATRFASGGAVRISVRLLQSEDKSSKFLEFAIIDEGPGMTRSFIESELLQPFKKGSFYVQGVGIGMALAANLCKLLSAELKVESHVGVGTKVLFTVATEVSEQDFEVISEFAVKAAAFLGFDSTSSNSKKMVQDFISKDLLENGVKSCKPEMAEGE